MCRRARAGVCDDWDEFADHTSAHGIPRAHVSDGYRKVLWYITVLCCVCAFVYQAVLIVKRFHRNDIIVGVEIRFEQIKFPAVTVCNMNPYKNSLARQSPTIKTALESFQFAIDKSTGVELHRMKRSSELEEMPSVEAAHIYCREDNGYFVPDPLSNYTCTCATFVGEENYWNCAPSTEWNLSLCELEEDDSDRPSVCFCRNDFCIESDGQIQVEGRWPIHLTSNASTKSICAEQNDSGAPSYCAPFQNWNLAVCQGCDWWGRCSRSFGLYGDDCLCVKDSIYDCFAVVKRTRRRRSVEGTKSIRIRREHKRIYERILSHYEGLLAVYSHCSCKSKRDCTALKEKERTNTTCLCFYNKKNDQVWPCYRQEDWEERTCTRCSTFGDCMYADTNNTKASIPCFCALPIKMCVRIDPPEGNVTDLEERIVKFWDIQPSTTVSPVQKKKQDREKAYGYTGVKDPIALKAKAMENIIFAVDQLTLQEKWAISYNKSDFIIKCSFNGKECHVEQDFESYLDPTYGACFTYVASKMENMTNERAGPAYGLRLEVFVNVTEYLPTTEAAGVRLTVHSHEEQPFPDTLGYSAPTGFVSSFGIRLKSMTRLPSPYGECVKHGKDEDFIYVDKQYSTEGCQRSCIQRHLAKTCGCGDPRFPPYRSYKNCPVDEPDKRTCIKEQIRYVTSHSMELGCKCQQPCNQDVYTVTYSASRWPAVPGDASGCPIGMNAHHCLLYKREQGAMIEVFFEQLNYESLLESEAYGLPNLLADFGGQLGLWMGVSVITIMEFGLLLFDVFWTVFTNIFGIRRKKRTPKRSINSYRYSLTKPPPLQLHDNMG